MAVQTEEKNFSGKISGRSFRKLTVDGSVEVYFRLGTGWTTNPVTYETGAYNIGNDSASIKVVPVGSSTYEVS